MLTYNFRRRSQDIIFSWHVYFPFTILNADMWMLCHFTGSTGNVFFMNVMYDMIQFVVVVPVPNEVAATLIKYFM